MISISQKVRVAVVGCGVFGRHHARIYHQLEQDGVGVQLVGVVDTQPDRAHRLAQEFRTQSFSSLEDLKGKIDAASVTVPTVHHLAAARELMQAGADVLIEKPVTASLAQADELIALAERLNRVAQVGHLERFNPAVLATVPLVTKPMFFEVHRLSVFTPRSLDVDVVMDLMIHDLDVVLSLVKVPVREIRAVGLAVISNKVDIANVRIEFDNGCVANFTASRVSTEKVRKVRFFQPHQYISIDYARQDVISIRVDERAAAALLSGQPLPPLSGPVPGIALDKPKVETREPLRTEMESFLESVRTRTKPQVSLQDGRKALDLALRINSAIEAHHGRAGLAHIG
ncbi:MAG TPA: Gfo/Idh/MocA family oxidoreductase [Terriglobales bacterium]|nr:Gfo/Idh/MocA family oxidoreductase [Terriglobales bacterium]